MPKSDATSPASKPPAEDTKGDAKSADPVKSEVVKTENPTEETQ